MTNQPTGPQTAPMANPPPIAARRGGEPLGRRPAQVPHARPPTPARRPNPPATPKIHHGRASRVAVALAARLGLEEQHGAGGRHRDGVEGRDERRNGDRHRELAEKLPGDAADKAHGTNTAHSTTATATIGPVTSSMALMVAVRMS